MHQPAIYREFRAVFAHHFAEKFHGEFAALKVVEDDLKNLRLKLAGRDRSDDLREWREHLRGDGAVRVDHLLHSHEPFKVVLLGTVIGGRGDVEGELVVNRFEREADGDPVFGGCRFGTRLRQRRVDNRLRLFVERYHLSVAAILLLGLDVHLDRLPEIAPE